MSGLIDIELASEIPDAVLEAASDAELHEHYQAINAEFQIVCTKISKLNARIKCSLPPLKAKHMKTRMRLLSVKERLILNKQIVREEQHARGPLESPMMKAISRIEEKLDRVLKALGEEE